ncbi:MAG: hypothetical protein QOI58_1662 [Thermoanaerobaculia bacterium]|jgi:chloramphenicol 3-O-phosphotransferase|nr:hypothetical protein [Thermoanaerobaculia bacterium]
MSEAAENVVVPQPKSVDSEAGPDAALSKQVPPGIAGQQPPIEILRPEEPPQPDRETKQPAASGWVPAVDRNPEPVERPAALKVVIGSNASGQNMFANNLYQFAAPASEVMFSADLASRIGDAAERELLAVVTIDSDFAACVRAALEKQRVVLISGAAHSGKGTVAKYLAAELASRQGLTQETYVVGPLESRVRVLPRALAADGNFGNRVTIFTDAFEKEHKDLLNFFSSDSAAWEELRTSLAANDAYFIFTTSHTRMNAFRDRLRVNAFEVAPWPELIATSIERKLAWLESQPAGRKEKVHEVREKREVIAAKLQTIPRIASMIDDYVGGGEHFDVVLERHASASPSLLDDLQTDVDAWCFALTVAIAETAEKPLPWSAFERLRRSLTSHIKDDRELIPPLGIRRPGLVAARGQRPSTAWLSDKPLFTRCRAVFREDASGAHVVAFTDPDCGRGIRKSLLDHHRRLLLMLAPFLRRMAEGADVPDSLHSIAAYTLGSIGSIDPPEISLPLLSVESGWVSEGQPRSLIGQLVRGALGASDERYRGAVLRALSRIAKVAPESLDDVAAARLRTAIDAYSQLGKCPDAKPMVQLREIAACHCVPALTRAYEHFVEVDKANREQVAVRSQKALDEARDRGRMHLGLGLADLAICDVVARPLQQAIARLSLDDVHAVTAMRDWLSVGGAEMRLLVPYLFLIDGGVADWLEYLATGAGGDGSKTTNDVVFEAAASRQFQHELAGFLCDVYGAIRNNPSISVDIQEVLERRLAECLIRWVTTAAPAPQFRHGLEELFGTLAAARGGFMRRWLFALIRRPAFTQSEAMKEFASAARRQMDE